MATNWPIVFMGTPEIAALTLKELLQGPEPVVGAVTQPDRPAGRGHKTISSPLRAVAERYDVPGGTPETMRRLKDGTLAPQTQDEAKATFAPMIKKEDGLIDWSRSAAEIECRVRGFTPWPSAYTHLRGKLIKVHRAKVIATTERGNPGEIIRADGRGFWEAPRSGALSLEEVQLENRKRLLGVEFLKGARMGKGERL